MTDQIFCICLPMKLFNLWVEVKANYGFKSDIKFIEHVLNILCELPKEINVSDERNKTELVAYGQNNNNNCDVPSSAVVSLDKSEAYQSSVTIELCPNENEESSDMCSHCGISNEHTTETCDRACLQCENVLVFDQPAQLKQHQLQIHNKHTCAYCGELLTGVLEFEKHLKERCSPRRRKRINYRELNGGAVRKVSESLILELTDNEANTKDKDNENDIIETKSNNESDIQNTEKQCDSTLNVAETESFNADSKPNGRQGEIPSNIDSIPQVSEIKSEEEVEDDDATVGFWEDEDSCGPTLDQVHPIIERHEGPEKCKYCNQRHFSEQCTRTCLECSPIVMFNNRKELLRHRRCLHKQFMCAQCGEQVLTRAALNNHSRIHAVKDKKTGQRTQRSQTTAAGRTLPEELEAERHKKDILGACKCDRCGKVFDNGERLFWHLSNVHFRKREDHPCSECGKLFRSVEKMRHHVDSYHRGIRYQCGYENCGKLYRAKSYLKEHISVCHEPAASGDRSFLCPTCGKAFRSRARLTGHIIRCHSERNNQACDHCGKVLSSAQSLEDHVNSVHRKVQLYFCQQCGKGYASKKQLQKHGKKYHSPRRELARATNNMERGRHMKRYNLTCDHCGKVLCSAQNLEDHINSVHRKLQLYFCQQCSKGYASKKQLQKHEKKYHSPGRELARATNNMERGCVI